VVHQLDNIDERLRLREMQVLHASILAEGMEEDNLLKKKIELKTGGRGLFFHKNCLRIYDLY
jgi:hypothetical protein